MEFANVQISSVPAAPVEEPAAAAAVVPPLVEEQDRKVPSRPYPAQSMRKIRVLLADDSGVVRKQLAQLLQLQPDVDVVGQAVDGMEAVRMAMHLRPDVVIMDVRMPVLDGPEATYCIRQGLPAVQVLGLSMHDDHDTAMTMTVAGAAEYLTKTTPATKLIATIRGLAAQVCRS